MRTVLEPPLGCPLRLCIWETTPLSSSCIFCFRLYFFSFLLCLSGRMGLVAFGSQDVCAKPKVCTQHVVISCTISPLDGACLVTSSIQITGCLLLASASCNMGRGADKSCDLSHVCNICPVSSVIHLKSRNICVTCVSKVPLKHLGLQAGCPNKSHRTE